MSAEAMGAPVFNLDERAAQNLAGGGPRGHGIDTQLSDVQRRFFSQLSYAFVGVADASGWPLASVVSGPPGFVQSPDPSALVIASLPGMGDPARDELVSERQIGVLGIDLSTRRRNRANGRIVGRDDQGLRIAVEQSFGNCPQYIQLRNTVAPAAAGASPVPVQTLTSLDAAARAAITAADTFFVASRSRPGAGPGFGADISHRGGLPGFVRVEGNLLIIPDFRGNRYFNTLGNFLAEPRASLLFVDFLGGDLLQLQGTAQIDWNAPGESFAGAERLWTFSVERGWRRPAALDLRWHLLEVSRTASHAGNWRNPASAVSGH